MKFLLFICLLITHKAAKIHTVITYVPADIRTVIIIIIIIIIINRFV